MAGAVSGFGNHGALVPISSDHYVGDEEKALVGEVTPAPRGSLCGLSRVQGYEIWEWSIAIAATGKGALGLGNLVAALAKEELFEFGPLLGVLVGLLGGVGFYRDNVRTGLQLWLKLLQCCARVSEDEHRRPLLSVSISDARDSEVTEPVSEADGYRIRWPVRATIIIGSIAFSLTQSMSVIQAGSDPKGVPTGTIVGAIVVGLANIVIGPGNMATFLERMGALNEHEAHAVFKVKDRLEGPKGCCSNFLILVYSTMGAGTNILAGAAFVLWLAGDMKDASSSARGAIVGTGIVVGTLCSIVAIGMNVDGAKKTGLNFREAGGCKPFFLNCKNLALMAFIFITNSLPSNYLGADGMEHTSSEIGTFLNGNSTVVTVDDMVAGESPFVNLLSGSLMVATGVVFAAGVAAQTLNKGPAAEQVLGNICGGFSWAFSRVSACAGAFAVAMGCCPRRGRDTPRGFFEREHEEGGRHPMP